MKESHSSEPTTSNSTGIASSHTLPRYHEYGQVELCSLGAGFPLLSNLNLKLITGDMRVEAIEIHDLAVSGSLVIATSAGGNDIIRASDTPPYTLFYLYLK